MTPRRLSGRRWIRWTMPDADQRQPDGLPRRLAYQSKWCGEKARFAVCEKGRRIGLSWADASERVLHAARGAGNIMYMSYNKDMTETYIGDCADWARYFHLATSDVKEETIITKDREQVHRYRIDMDSGKSVIALPSNPRVLRSKGKPGDVVIIDEAAFCDDLDALLKAAIAVTQWGGTVRIISTHNGEASPFNRLVCDIRDGRHPQWALHSITLRDAIADGLARRVFTVTGREWYDGAAEDWCEEVVGGYTSKEDADEELFCIPSKAGGAWLHWDWIRQAQHELAGEPALYMGRPGWAGVDIARRRHLWVATVIEQVGDIFWEREMRVEQNIKFSDQKAIIRDMRGRYNLVRIGVDQTGMGEAVVEDWQSEFGELQVEGVLLSSPRRLAVATVLREVFEDNRIRISKDRLLAEDLRSIKRDTGITDSPRLVAEGSDGHADRFWALGLGVATAVTTPASEINHRSAGERETQTIGVDGYMGEMGGNIHELRGYMYG